MTTKCRRCKLQLLNSTEIYVTAGREMVNNSDNIYIQIFDTEGKLIIEVLRSAIAYIDYTI